MSYNSTYDEIKAKCLKEGLFEDPDFRADDSTLCYNPQEPSEKPYVWKRPKEILGMSGTPKFFVDGASRFDIKQHQLGDCWMLAAMSCLTMHPDLRKRVVPDGQSFKDEEYDGKFHFNLWSFGEWVPVIIDDRLPTNDWGLVYTGSSEQNEFWTALLEKAFAKLHGSYKALQGGRATEAMEDFTGGIGKSYQLRPKAPSNLWNIMLKAHGSGSLMCCATGPDKTEDNGLPEKHAYSVTRVVSVNTQQFGNLQMVRVRNPWGEADEKWSGDWSDNSTKWNEISKLEQQLIGFDNGVENGEFCMTLEDFVKNFVRLDICYLGVESMTDDVVVLKEKRWERKCFEGCWKEGISAGGDVDSRNFCRNRQYGFEVVDFDEDDNKGTGTVIIALMQKDRRRQELNNLEIGYAIYKLEHPLSAPLDENFNFHHMINPLKSSGLREICGRHELRPGNYCVVPFTKTATKEADFILRLFTEKPVKSKELDEPTGIMDPSRSEVKPASEYLKKCVEMWEAFHTNSGKTQKIDVWDLQQILNAEFMKEIKFDGLSDETCKSLVALKQVGRSSMLGYREFVELWILLQTWNAAFKNLDKDGNGTIDSYELRHAMHDIGYSVSNQTFSALVLACSGKDRKIPFDKFIRAMARLNTVVEVHNKISYGREDSNAAFNLDEFIQLTM